MKWFRKKIGRLSIVHIGHTLHTSNYCGHALTYTKLYIAWNGVEKWGIITGIQDETRGAKREK